MPADDPRGGLLELGIAGGQERRRPARGRAGRRPSGRARPGPRAGRAGSVLSQAGRRASRIGDLDQGISERVFEDAVGPGDLAEGLREARARPTSVADSPQGLGRGPAVVQRRAVEQLDQRRDRPRGRAAGWPNGSRPGGPSRRDRRGARRSRPAPTGDRSGRPSRRRSAALRASDPPRAASASERATAAPRLARPELSIARCCTAGRGSSSRPASSMRRHASSTPASSPAGPRPWVRPWRRTR